MRELRCPVRRACADAVPKIAVRKCRRRIQARSTVRRGAAPEKKGLLEVTRKWKKGEPLVSEEIDILFDSVFPNMINLPFNTVTSKILKFTSQSPSKNEIINHSILLVELF